MRSLIGNLFVERKLKSGKLAGCLASGMKSSVLVFSLVSLALSSCGEDQIKVTSDLGEEIILKDSAVTTSGMDSYYKKWKELNTDLLKNSQNHYEGCLAKHRGYINCEDSWMKFINSDRKNLAAIDSLEAEDALVLVQYRAINKNVQGELRADSDYTRVMCVKKGTDADTREKVLLSLAVPFTKAKDEQDRDKTKVTIAGTSSKIRDVAERELCEKYG